MCWSALTIERTFTYPSQPSTGERLGVTARRFLIPGMIPRAGRNAAHHEWVLSDLESTILRAIVLPHPRSEFGLYVRGSWGLRA